MTRRRQDVVFNGCFHCFIFDLVEKLLDAEVVDLEAVVIGLGRVLAEIVALQLSRPERERLFRDVRRMLRESKAFDALAMTRVEGHA